jgi:transposase InsO family protein
VYFYLYLILDIWSRKIVGWAVHEIEDSEYAARLIREAVIREQVEEDQLVLHSDNGSPMKGATMVATLQRLGIVPSFSRPRVSNDNPFSEAAFSTMKTGPAYPTTPFEDIEAAERWVAGFVHWYNHEHLHSGIRFITPVDRHTGDEQEVLEKREEVYRAARRRHPERWSGNTRNWNPVQEVFLNPEKAKPDCSQTQRRSA